MTTIENQNKDKENNQDEKNESTLGTAAMAFLRIGIWLLVVLVIGWFGSNFVYLTRIDLDMFLPTDTDKKPYTRFSNDTTEIEATSSKKGGSVSGSGSGSGSSSKNYVGGSVGAASGICGTPIDFTKGSMYTNMIGEQMFGYGYPYNTNTKDSSIGSFVNSWISNKVKYSYVWLRSFLKSVIRFFEKTCGLLPESMADIIPFVVGPIVIPLIIGIVSTIWGLVNLVSFFWNEDQGWKGLLTTCWILPTFIMLVCLHFIQTIGVMFKLTLLPVFLNPSKILEIMDRKFNSFYMLLLFVIGAIVVNLPYIPTLWSIVSSIVALIALIYISNNDLSTHGQ